ncbi:hypothetical protein Purlil1_5804 [Purpureocillium lilacinum]|uniref:Uncharacterized protein n=1 Tax=Purpureocillium lilacinum TaxID=33203 RepID=A0ABR0C0Z9_PURLI|nr:hypothetical protein Purlil1_5804 [Purpureocillium lilacinum]
MQQQSSGGRGRSAVVARPPDRRQDSSSTLGTGSPYSGWGHRSMDDVVPRQPGTSPSPPSSSNSPTRNPRYPPDSNVMMSCSLPFPPITLTTHALAAGYGPSGATFLPPPLPVPSLPFAPHPPSLLVMEHLTRSPAAHPSIHLSIHQSIHPILQLSTPPLSSVVVPFAVPVVNGTDTRPHRTAAPTPPPTLCNLRVPHTYT